MTEALEAWAVANLRDILLASYLLVGGGVGLTIMWPSPEDKADEIDPVGIVLGVLVITITWPAVLIAILFRWICENVTT